MIGLLLIVQISYGVIAVGQSHIIVNDWQDDLAVQHANHASQSPGASTMKDMEQLWWGNSISGIYGATPATGVRVTEGRALTSVTALACSRARAETLASLPPIVYKQIDETRRGRARGSDPWYLLHDEPNPDMDSMTFYELMNMRMVNRGNAFAEIERDGADRPIHLWPIHPSRVLPRRVTEGNKSYVEWDVFVDSRDLVTGGYRFFTIPDRDMLNIPSFGGNGIISPGVLDFGVEEISLDLSALLYGSDWFKGGARPAGMVEHPGYIEDDDVRRVFREDINKPFSGRENWNKIGVLWQGAKYKEMQASPEQAQFLETRNFTARNLCRLWNVPPAIVQIFDDYKFNTVDAMIMQFVMTCVRADAVRFERAFRRKVLCHRDDRGRLIESFGAEYFMEFLLEGLLRGDAKKQAETMEIKRRNGVVNANEWRNKDNENPLPGDQGEKYILPGGFSDLAKLGQETSGSRPRQSNGGSDNASASDIGPQFDRQSLIGLLESRRGPRGNVSRGYSLAASERKKSKPKSSESSELRLAAADVLVEAVARINAILANKLQRLASKNDQLNETDWSKHERLLAEAMLPACRVALMRSRDDRYADLAYHIATKIVQKSKAVGAAVEVDRKVAARLLQAARKSLKKGS